MARDLLILGTGGNSLDILEAVRAGNAAAGEPQYVPRGFLDDAPGLQGRIVHGLPVVGPLAAAAEWPDAFLVNGIGNPRNYRDKPEIIARTGAGDDRFAVVAHPRAAVSPSARLARGAVVLANATVGCDVVVGRHAIVLPGAVLSHHVRIGDFTCIASGAVLCGEVAVGDGCYVGARAVIRERLNVATGSLVGMGGVVVADVAPGATVAGNPARQVEG